jgi:hypothetical protein
MAAKEPRQPAAAGAASGSPAQAASRPLLIVNLRARTPCEGHGARENGRKSSQSSTAVGGGAESSQLYVDGACTQGTPGMGYYKVAYCSGGGVGGVCPGATPPRCSFNTSDAHPGQGLGHCEPPGNFPEIAGCSCGLLQGFCTSNPDANCQIPKCCNCCMWPCQLTPDPETCCEQYPACCL